MKLNPYQQYSVQWYRMMVAVLLLFLVFNLPIASALEISNTRVEEVTSTSAVVRWNTDEEADSLVYYGTERDVLTSRADAALVTSHALPVDGLAPATSYLYRVESSGVTEEAVDDHGGAYYQFTTLPPDGESPPLLVELPEVIQGTRLDIEGTTEAGASVGLYVNEAIFARVTAENEDGIGDVSDSAEDSSGGSFVFSNVILEAEQLNQIRVVSTDTAGNTAEFSGVVFADTLLPRMEFQDIPELVETREFTVQATLSEESSWELLQQDRSVAQGSGTEIAQQVNLEEGENKFQLRITDRAGWEAIQEFSIILDTLDPTITAEIEEGTEYFEGREESNIHGKTEPGARIFLYVYKPKGFEFHPDFRKARTVIDASSTGDFTFEDVDFSRSVDDFSLEDLAPQQVPSGLQEVAIFPIAEVTQQERSTAYVYLIAEDKTGKTGFWQSQVNVVSCYGGEIAFGVESMPEFQAPYKLVPQLLDDGRQDIQAVFKFSYTGGGVPQLTPDGKVVEEGFKIENVRFEPACTQKARDDDRFDLGCQLIPRTVGGSFVSGNSAYVQWVLQSASSLSKRKADFWNEFVKRQVVIPLKISVSYRERQPDGRYGDAKVQTSCQDIGYFVDIPVESDELAAPLVAIGSVDVLGVTIEGVHEFGEIVEKAYLISAIGCTGSWLFRTGARWIRITTEKVEPYFSYIKAAGEAKEKVDHQGAKEDPGKCPLDQTGLYLEETLMDWKELYDNYPGDKTDLHLPAEVVKAFASEEALKKLTLDVRCPSTTNAWKFESFLDTAFKWTCDRAFCRSVPAGWTATRDLDEIGSVIFQQEQCAVTGRGVPLIRRENCQELVKENPLNLAEKARAHLNDIQTCWQDKETRLYYLDPDENKNDALKENGLYTLSPVTRLFGTFEELDRKPLYVYRPPGSDDFIVARGETCKQVCTNPRKPGFGPDIEGGIAGTAEPAGKGCYNEHLIDGSLKLTGKDGLPLGDKDKGKKIIGNRYSAGYTKDCFIDGVNSDKAGGITGNPTLTDGQPTFQQCVCQGKQEESTQYQSKTNTLRTAVKEDDQGNAEAWSYREERKFEETRKLKGTYYPSIRYYSGRDFSGAFGQDYLFDYFEPEGEEEVHEVNPHSQIIGAFQGVCLSSMLKYARMLESILVGSRNCLLEARYTGQFDAGMCKTLFTQHICGLAYKVFSYANSLSCTPLTFDEVGKEGAFGDVGVLVGEGLDALPVAVDSSIKDIKDDYGNAALNNYFQAGVAGLAQSACLAAFGVEFPLFSEDALLDAALATPVKSTVFLFPTERELSTYNPFKKLAVFNYDIGGVIIPGCKMRNWRVSLKCLGPEDLDRPGIDPTCGGEGCDCVNVPSIGAAYEAEKVRLVQSGQQVLKGDGQYFSLPLESPVKVESSYRYDHVVVELQLDPSERGNEELCFDEGYRDGKFYFPLTPIQTGTQLSCQADIVSGRYVCPQLSELFGIGGAYLEPPFVTCYSRTTDSWVDCTTADVFTVGDEIKTRVHLQTDGKGQCLKRTVSGLPTAAGSSLDLIRPIPENIPGPLAIPESLGTVREELFGGVYGQVWWDSTVSSPGCEDPVTVVTPPASSTTVQQAYNFVYELGATGSGNVKLKVPLGVTQPSGFTVSSDAHRYLQRIGGNEFDIATINALQFSFDGFTVNRVLGNVQPTAGGQCVLRWGTSRGGTTFSQNPNAKEISVTYELLERDEGGGCQLPKYRVKTTTGAAAHTQRIRLQREKTGLSSFHSNFLAGNYELIRAQAQQVVDRRGNDLEQALALYYITASYLMQGQREGASLKYDVQLKNALGAFFGRSWGGAPLPAWDPMTQGMPEYQKMRAYLCEVYKEVDATTAATTATAGGCT